jgi:predicted glycoside hydrolase/deacetylase ChbG (UPF0249 family)
MAMCPWRLHALHSLRATPETPFGIHLTAISEQPLYRWGSISCRSDVSSLLDETGYFYPEARIDEFLDQLNLAELEQEWRAQIDYVIAAGLRPTHLDSHCSIHVRRTPIFEMTLGLARSYNLALRAYIQPYINTLQQDRYP